MNSSNNGRKEVELGAIVKKPIPNEPRLSKHAQESLLGKNPTHTFEVEGGKPVIPTRANEVKRQVKTINLDHSKIAQPSAQELRQQNMAAMRKELSGPERAPMQGSNQHHRDVAAVLQDARSNYKIDRPIDKRNFVYRGVNTGVEKAKETNLVSTGLGFVPVVKEGQKLFNAEQLRNQANALEQSKPSYANQMHNVIDAESKNKREQSGVNRAGAIFTPLGWVEKAGFVGRDFVKDTSRKERIAASKDIKELNQPMPDQLKFSRKGMDDKNSGSSPHTLNTNQRMLAADSRDSHLNKIAVQDPKAREGILGTIDRAEIFKGKAITNDAKENIRDEIRHHNLSITGKDNRDEPKWSGVDKNTHNLRPSAVKKQIQSEAAIQRLKPNR